MSSYEFVGWLSLLLLFFGFEDIFERSTNIGAFINHKVHKIKQEDFSLKVSYIFGKILKHVHLIHTSYTFIILDT